MANVNSPFGLIPRKLRNGSPWMGPLRTYFHPSGDSAALYPGDPVILAGSADSRGVPTATLATAGATDRITGVVVGIQPSAPFQPQYGAASTAFYFTVCDDPAALFEVQEDSVGGAIAATAVGSNFNLVSAAGNANIGTSGWMLDSSTTSTDATYQVRLIELVNSPDNVIGNYAKWLVAINLPTETGAAGALGV